MRTQILVIGGGASGMMAAAAAADSGARVTICESGDIPGRKILATGNGRCNFTNRRIRPGSYRSSLNGAAAQVLRNFGEQETVEWFRSIGIPAAARGDCLYPRSMQAASVREALEWECRRLGVDIRTGIRAEEILAREKGFLVRVREYNRSRMREPVRNAGAREQSHGTVCPDRDAGESPGEEIAADAVILACGGKAAPNTGSDGSGYALAESIGHRIVTPVPALVPLISPDPLCRLWKGVRTAGKVSLYVKGRNGREKRLAEDTGELQLTQNGISGIPVFQVSRFAARALADREKVLAELNFLPELGRDAFREAIMTSSPEKSFDLGRWLHGYFPDRLCRVLLRRADLREDQPLGQMNPDQVRQLAETACAFRLDITGTAGFEAAQVTAGGVSMREIAPETMESRICPGLFFSGEIVDVDGICGGYNLQFAWSSGYTAGHSAAVFVQTHCT